jgi:hypothetical protein
MAKTLHRVNSLKISISKPGKTGQKKLSGKLSQNPLFRKTDV